MNFKYMEIMKENKYLKNIKNICISTFQFSPWKYGHSRGFTLAETLLTLLIIGVLATITTPSLINNIENQKWKSGYKLLVHDATEALLRARTYDDIENFVPNVGTAHSRNFWALSRQMNVIKTCPYPNSLSCWNNSNSITINNHSESFIDSKGRMWMHSYAPSVVFVVDVNGNKPPNIYGKDIFNLTLTDEQGLEDSNACQSNMYSVNYTRVRAVCSKDFKDKNPTWCPEGNCYYKSWLYLN